MEESIEMSEIGRIYGPLYAGYPKYKKTSMTDRAGVGIVMNTLAKNNLYFKELPTGDVGVDGIIEPVIEESSTGLLIACQIKSSENAFIKKSRQKLFNFSKVNYTHYEYWLKKCIPVIIILVDTTNRICYWEHITETKIKKNKKSVSIKVPTIQTLHSEQTYGTLYEIALNRSQEDNKYYYLRKEKKLINNVSLSHTTMTFTKKKAGEADLELFIGGISCGITYFKYDSKTDLIDAIIQYFFWAKVTLTLSTQTQINVSLLVNDIGKKFLELEEELKDVTLEFP